MISIKNQLKARQFCFQSGNFTLNSGLSYKKNKVFSFACFFFSRYVTDQSQIKWGLEKHFKRPFHAQNNFEGLTLKRFFVDNSIKSFQKRKQRRDLILPKHIGRVFFVHNGKTFSSIQVLKKMLGHKFGEFASTRKQPVHKKKKAK